MEMDYSTPHQKVVDVTNWIYLAPNPWGWLDSASKVS
jgi:hypothetical protein